MPPQRRNTPTDPFDALFDQEPDVNAVEALIRPHNARTRLLHALDRLGQHLPQLSVFDLLVFLADRCEEDQPCDEALLRAAEAALQQPRPALRKVKPSNL